MDLIPSHAKHLRSHIAYLRSHIPLFNSVPISSGFVQFSWRENGGEMFPNGTLLRCGWGVKIG